jgi:uncharacterized membrane protein YraQ (UPF0718 family)
MMDLLDAVWSSLATAAGLFWRALWALALGYAFSAVIQVLIRSDEVADHLGGRRPRHLSAGLGWGFVSSSCSFAALSATRSLFAKGASLSASLAFLFASTNLAIEVAALAYIFLGWQYAAALFVGAPILVLFVVAMVVVTKPQSLTKEARESAQEATRSQEENDKDLPDEFGARIRSGAAWGRVGDAYIGEWAMVWKELLIGFTVAGVVVEVVPAEWFQTLFPTELPDVLTVVVQSLMAPVLAVLTFIGSMGNGPLAAVLATNGVVFGAIMTFLYADFVVPPAIKINARYYGWRFAFYLAAVFTVAAVASGIVVHGLFALVGQVPEGARNLNELARFDIDYTFYLNLVALVVAGALVVISRRRAKLGGSVAA